MILSCTKTGRFWNCANEAAARATAHEKGLKDYEIEPEPPHRKRGRILSFDKGDDG